MYILIPIILLILLALVAPMAALIFIALFGLGFLLGLADGDGENPTTKE